MYKVMIRDNMAPLAKEILFISFGINILFHFFKGRSAD